MFSEKKRQLVHILLFLLAFLLKYLGRLQAAILLTVLLLVTMYLVPKLKVRKFLHRQSEINYSQGAALYFLILLILVLIFPLRIVAASWAILAWGDGTATLIGKNFKVKELPWNKNKSYVGTLSFIFFGTLGSAALLKWMSPELPLDLIFSASFKTALIAGIVESLPWRINDNISVAATSAIVMTFLL